MADSPGSPTSWLDLLDEEIPVVDKSGNALVIKGADFVSANSAPSSPVVPSAAAGDATAASSAPAAASAPMPSTVQAPAPVKLALDAPATAQPSSPPQPEAKPQMTKADLGLESDKDAADIKKIEAIMKAKTGGPVMETKAEVAQLDTVVDKAVAETAAGLADEDMRRRYRTLLSLYFRDLRDLLETKSKFTMPVQSGGMGMSDADADAATQKLQALNAEYHASLTGKAVDDKAKYVAERTDKILGDQDRTVAADEQKREQAFTGLLERSGTGSGATATPSLPAPTPVKEPKMVAVVGLDAAGKPLPTAVPTPPSAAPASPAAPAPVAAAAAVPPAEPAKPAMADVKFTPKLTGPVEELRALLLKDFRRLSKDPREATLKLKDKIDLLEEQSFDVKTQGIKAWQESEVNKLYLDILRKSLEGKPVNEVIAERDAKGEMALNKAEFDAIMELNRKLRFG